MGVGVTNHRVLQGTNARFSRDFPAYPAKCELHFPDKGWNFIVVCGPRMISVVWDRLLYDETWTTELVILFSPLLAAQSLVDASFLPGT
jgi:hypothetical protein